MVMVAPAVRFGATMIAQEVALAGEVVPVASGVVTTIIMAAVSGVKRAS